MGLASCWIVRVHVPIGVRSRRRPFAELRAVAAAVRRHPGVGAVGQYRQVEHFSVGLERFVAPGADVRTLVPVVTITTYVHGASLGEIERLARAIAAAHPWEHPVVQCTGPEGAFLWGREGKA